MSRFLFPEWTDKFKRWVALLALGAPIYLIALVAYGVSPEAIRIGYQPTQPVPYSHALHVGELGMDCRYCHNTVEKAGHAAIPPADTCMNCHFGIRPDSPKLTPIREAYAKGTAVKWVRVHDLPDYVYFNHSAHVTRGIGCESCHGRVDRMEEVYQAKPLTMEWCLGCHNNPDYHLRPPEKATVMGYLEQESRPEGSKLREDNDIAPPINCSTCHR
jgi:hypothetical protein